MKPCAERQRQAAPSLMKCRMADGAESRCDHPWHLLEYMKVAGGECDLVRFNGMELSLFLIRSTPLSLHQQPSTRDYIPQRSTGKRQL
jgi:hypothetical protein